MKLHLPKALAAAVMALFAVPNALAETVTITMGGNQYAGTTVLTEETTSEPTEGGYVLFTRDTNVPYTVNSSSDWVCTTSKTLMAGSATSGNITYNPSPLYVDASSGNIAVGANLIVGSTEDNADVLHFKGSDTTAAVLNGQVSVVNTLARIWNEAGTNYMQGKILAEGKTIKVVGKTAGTVLRLAGGGTIGTLNLGQAGGSVTLSATNQAGTAVTSKEYTITTLNSEDSSAALTVESGVTLNLTNLTAGKLINKGILNLGGTDTSWTLSEQWLTNAGVLNVLEGTAVNLDSTWLAGAIIGSAATTTVESEDGTVTNPANGFGKISSFELSSLIAGTVNVESGVSWKAGENTLTYSNGVLSYGNGQILTSTIYQINDAASGYDLDGATSVVIGATNGTVSLTEATGLDITVMQGASLDINGKECGDCDLVLSGGSLKNSGGSIDSYQKQLNSLTLTANSTVNAEDGKSYGVVAGGWGNTFIDLGGYMLTKTGDGQFYAASTNLRGGGTLKITGGDFNLGVAPNGTGGRVASIGHVDDSDDTNIWFTGGTLSSGKGIQLNRNVEFLAMAEDDSTAGVTGTISAALNIGKNTATFKANSQNDKLIISGMISGSGRITVDGAGEVQYKNATADSQNLANSVVEIKTSAKLNLLAVWKSHTYLGALTGEGTLQTSCASESSQTDGYRATVISGDASEFTGEWRLYTTGGSSSNRRVRGVLNTGTFGGVVNFTGDNVVDTAVGSQLLLAMDSKVAGLEGTMKNAEVMGISADSVSNDKLMGKTSDVSGQGRTLTITANKDCSYSGKINANVSLIVGDGTNAASQTFDGATVGGSMELKKQATVTATGNTSIAALKGTGTLTTSGASVTDGSTFTGTLESTAGTLTVTQVGATLAAVKAEGGDINLLETSSVTVKDMVIGAGQMVGVYNGETGAMGDVSVTTLKVTSSEGSAARLYASLNLSEGGTLTLNGTLTMGSKLTQVTLTLGRGITLCGSLLDSWMDRSNALTLFSGVDGLTVNGASVAAGETSGVKASEVFGDSWSNYSLVMTGGTNNKDYNVLLVQTSDTPEPTTATLSLLALMGLAARRRRKAAK